MTAEEMQYAQAKRRLERRKSHAQVIFFVGLAFALIVGFVLNVDLTPSPAPSGQAAQPSTASRQPDWHGVVHTLHLTQEKTKPMQIPAGRCIRWWEDGSPHASTLQVYVGAFNDDTLIPWSEFKLKRQNFDWWSAAAKGEKATVYYQFLHANECANPPAIPTQKPKITVQDDIGKQHTLVVKDVWSEPIFLPNNRCFRVWGDNPDGKLFEIEAKTDKWYPWAEAMKKGEHPSWARFRATGDTANVHYTFYDLASSKCEKR